MVPRWGAVAAIAGAFGLVAIAAILAAPAAAAPPATGDWNITGPETYSNQVITLSNETDGMGNATLWGNVTILPGASLTFQNVTLVLPFQSTLDIQGRADFGNSTIVGETWKLWVRNDSVFVRDRFVNATYGGTSIENANSVFDNLTWDCGGNSNGVIHIKRPIDFRDHLLKEGCSMSIELATLTVNKNIEYTRLTILNASGATGITFGDSSHTGNVRFELHNLTINNTGSGWGIYIGATANTTTVWIHDSSFAYTGSAAIRADSTQALLRIWQCSFEGVLRAARINGIAAGTVVGYIDNIYVNGTTDSIYAEDATWIIHNATVLSPSPQFAAGPNGHIKIWDSADSAFLSDAPSAGASIEHFIRLEMAAPTWQNAIPIIGNLVTLLDSNGVPGMLVNASTWTPQEIVWWGMYPNNARVDNRQVRPVIQDGGTTFNCTPSAFFVTPGMALTSVTCNDNAPPTIVFVSPAFPRIQNSSTINGTARVDEAGSGLNTVEFSLDGSAFGPVTFAPGETRNFTFSRAPMPDGTYTVTLRAMDRTGNARVVMSGRYVVDTVAPGLSFDPPPPTVAASSNYTFTGDTEPNTSVVVARAGGFSNSTFSGGNGRFAIGVLLEEGLNSYTLTARDAAGNGFSLSASLLVDTRPPALAVLLDGEAQTTAREAAPTVRVGGTAEVGAEVAVNGQLATRTGAAFTFDLTLPRGLTNLTVVAVDAAGNRAEWFGFAYYDDGVPTLTLEVNGVPAASGGTVVTRSGSASFAGTAQDGDSGIASLIVNGQAVAVDGAGRYSTVVAVLEGDNVLVVTASDAVGNTASITVHVLRDATAPSVALALDADGSPVVVAGGENYTAGATVKLIVVASEAGAATFGRVAHAVVAGENAFIVDLAEGRNSFTVTFVDLAGNPAFPASIVIERKSSPPSLTLSSPLADASVDTAVVEVVGSTDPFSVVHVNGQVAAVSATGEFRTTVPLALGSNTLHVEAQDALGNLASANRTVTRTAPPPATISTTSGGLGVESMVLLVVGLAIGAGAGMSMGRRARASAPAEGPPAPEPLAASAKTYQSPAVGQQRGPKGPRGPSPPQ